MSELLGARTDVLDRNAESISTGARRVQDIRILAQRAVAELQTGWSGSDLIQLTRQWELQASPLLAEVAASLEACAALLRAQSAAQRLASSSDGSGLGRGELMTMAPSPSRLPIRTSPAATATWWRSLTPQQQQQVVREHPEWIGNRDGISFTARDLANRALLVVDRDHLVAEGERLVAESEADEADGAGSWSGVIVPGDNLTALIQAAALGRVKDRLATIAAVEATLARPGERQLLLLDIEQKRPLAAIANGNVGTADNVAVLVPGVSTNVADSMEGLDADMQQLQQRAEQESGQTHPTQTGTTATISWIGYQTPEQGTDVLSSDISLASDNLARKGAAQLAPFLLGIEAARDRDAHLTLLGHSYGSTTGGLALRQDTGVDDAVFFGSPGLGTSHLEDLQLAPGHSYYLEADRDAVGDLGHFGIDPSHMDGIKHVSTHESTVVDPASGQTRHLTEVRGHSSYLLDGSTSQYNVSVVVAAVPDRRVYDNGEGFGDVLSWPIPGMY